MFPPNENRSSLLPTCLRILALTLCVALGAPAAAHEPANVADIVVVSIRGEVRVTMLGSPRAVQAGTIVELPAMIRTGHDGAIDLRQGNTTVAIAADTELKLPATAGPGASIERLIQTRGNAFYDVGKRESRKLRVETPYLVAVIKGTQFNVAVQDDSSTISLFEGRLEVRAPDDSDVVDLNAGEIAIRHATDKAIRILRMDGSKPPATTSNDTISRAFAPGEADDGAHPSRVLPPIGAGGTLVGEHGPAIPVVPAGSDPDVRLDMRADAANTAVVLDAGDGAVDAGVTAKVDDAVALQVDAGVDLASGAANVGTDASVDLGAASVAAGLSAGVDLGAATLDAAADASVDLGPAAADVGVDTAADLGAGTIDVAADAGVDLGADAADVGADAGLDLGAGTVDVSTDTAVDLGVASLDSGTDVGVDLSGAAVDAGADVAADLGAAQVDAGIDMSLEPAASSVDAGLDTSVAGADVGVDLGVDLGSGELGLDIGLGGLDIGLGTDSDTDTTPAPAPPETDNGGLLGGLLGGRRSN